MGFGRVLLKNRECDTKYLRLRLESLMEESLIHAESGIDGELSGDRDVGLILAEDHY